MRQLLVALTTALLFSGCGGQSADGQPGEGGGGAAGQAGDNSGAGNAGSGQDFQSDLPSDTSLGDLNSDQSAQLCDELDGYAEQISGSDLTTLICRFVAVTGGLSAAQSGGDIGATCQSDLEACLAGAAGTTCPASDPSCTSTVGELEACVSSMAPLADALDTGAPSCDQIDPALYSQLLFALPSVQSACSSVQQNCPTLLGPLAN